MKLRLNTLDGFSTTASIITSTQFDAGAAELPIDPATLDPRGIHVINMNDPREQVPVRVVCRGVCDPANPLPSKEPDQIALFPLNPLRSHTPYAVPWTGAQPDAGPSVCGASRRRSRSTPAPSSRWRGSPRRWWTVATA